MNLLFRALGAALLVLTTVPLFRLLDRPATGPIGGATLRTTLAQVQFLWTASLILVAVAVVVALVLPVRAGSSALDRAAGLLTRGSDRVFALALGAAALIATGVQHGLVFRGRPNVIDAAAQLIHARYLAAGRLTGPGPESLEGGAWYFPNTVVPPEGWVSHFPPGHSLVLAPGLALGLPWLGPLLVAGLTGWLLARAALRLFPDDPLVARGGAVVGALSPLLLMQTAAFMNHGTAALLGVATILAALHARAGRGPWSLAAGAGVTALLAVRPLAAVAVCLTVVLLVWMPRGVAGETAGASGVPGTEHWRGLALRCAGAGIGGLPFLLLHGWYNHHLFGHPTTFGYHWSFGEAAGLGWGLDPWGNRYGWLEAVGYTSADLSTLNLNLAEFPLPLVSLAGLALVVGWARGWRERLVAGWALLPVGLGALYWHHGNFMGPRMLAEFAPAWGLLGVAGMAHLLRALPGAAPPGGARPAGPRAGGSARLSPRRLGQLVVAGAVLGALALAPYRMAGVGGELASGYRMAEPAVPPGAVVFMSSSWLSRMNGEMISRGVPQIVMETAISQNPTCLVEEYRAALHRSEGPFAAYADRYPTPGVWGEGEIPERHEAGALQASGASGPLPPLALVRRSPPYEGLQIGAIGQGTQIRYHAGEGLTDRCVRQIRADERGGLLEAGYLLWLGGLPGIEGEKTIYVREMGPELNERVLERYPDREAWVWFRPSRDARPELAPYPEGMARIWGEVEPVPPSAPRPGDRQDLPGQDPAGGADAVLSTNPIHRRAVALGDDPERLAPGDPVGAGLGRTSAGRTPTGGNGELLTHQDATAGDAVGPANVVLAHPVAAGDAPEGLPPCDPVARGPCRRASSGNGQILAGQDPASTDPVGPAQLRLADSVALGDGGKGLSPCHPVARGPGPPAPSVRGGGRRLGAPGSGRLTGLGLGRTLELRAPARGDLGRAGL